MSPNNSLRLTFALAPLILCMGACSRGVPGEKTGGPGKQGESNRQKVLVRELRTGVVAADGMLFIMSHTLASTKDEVKQKVHLDAGDTLTLDSESRTEFSSPVDKKPFSSPGEWKKDPKSYDFLLDWSIDWTEQSKTSMGQPLMLTVKETLKVEKVVAPKTANSWTCTYNLQGPATLASTTEADEKLALEQIKSIVIPLREPILKEIKLFIEANK